MAVGISLALAGPVSADAPTPPIPRDLPAEIEDYAPYQPQRSCDPAAKAGVAAFAHMLLAVYENTGSSGISRGCSIGGTSEHKEGRAFDWDVSVTNATERQRAEALLGWLLAERNGHEAAMARRLGIMYIIWDRQIWGSYKAAKGWRPYSGSNPHTDHVHFSFDWAGACKITSYWDGTVASGPGGPPCDSADLSKGRALPSGWLRKTTSPSGSAGDFTAAVAALQRLLGVPVDGERGQGTVASIRAFQRSHGLAVDGVAGPKTWAALRQARLDSSGVAEQRYTRSVAKLQRLLDVTVDGRYGPATTAAVEDFQRSHGLAVDGIAGPKTWAALRSTG